MLMKAIDKCVGKSIKMFFSMKSIIKDYNNNFSHHLPWEYLIDEKTVKLKNGGLMQVFKLQFFDLDYLGISELKDVYYTFQNTLKKIDKNMVYHFESRRIQDNNYITKDIDNLYVSSKLIDVARYEKFNRRNHFKTEHYVSITYMLPTDQENKFSNFLKEKEHEKSIYDLRLVQDELNKFNDIIETIKTSFSSHVVQQGGITALENEELAGFLYGTINTEFRNVLAIDPYDYLDYQISNSSYENTKNVMVNDYYLKTIVLKELPNMVNARILQELETLNFEYRIVNRFISMTKDEAKKVASSFKSLHFGKRKGLSSIIFEGIFQKEDTRNINEHAIQLSKEADKVGEILDRDLTIYGYFTPVIVILDKNKERLNEKILEIESIVKRYNFACESHNYNIFEAFEGAIPGQINSNIRRLPINVHNLSYLVPTSSPYLGETKNDHLKDIPLFYAQSNTNNVFNFNLHVEDVGNTIVIGAIGGGKSVLLGEIASQFLKYKDAQIFYFDKDSSSRVLCYTNGGQLYDLGKNELSFQPLSGVDDGLEREWASNFIISLLEQENFVVSPETKKCVWDALSSLAKVEEEMRTISTFNEYVQDSNIRMTLIPYTKDGPYGKYFDGKKNNLGYNNFQVFEMGTILTNPKVSLPILDYIFHTIETKRLISGVPTLIVMDEAWAYLQHKKFAEKIEESMRTLRKKNAIIVLATQSITDITQTEQNLRTALLTSTSTRIYLPNPQATDSFYNDYEAMGLSSPEILKISKSMKKKDYVIKQEKKGTAKIDLNLSVFEKIYVAVADTISQSKINEIRNKYKDELEELQYKKDFSRRKIEKFLIENQDIDYINQKGKAETIEQLQFLKNKKLENLRNIEELKVEVKQIEKEEYKFIIKINIEWIIYNYQKLKIQIEEDKTEAKYMRDLNFFAEIINDLNNKRIS